MMTREFLEICSERTDSADRGVLQYDTEAHVEDAAEIRP
jgi:hypothetical protein